MKKIFIKPINESIVLDKPIKKICFTDAFNYRFFNRNLMSNIIYSINNEEISLAKILLIKDPINIDINDKKTLTLLYKRLTAYVSFNLREKIAVIEKGIIDFFDEINYLTNYNLSYNGDLDISKIFSMYELAIKNVQFNNYLDFLLTYIKTNIELNDYSLIITFNLTKILDSEEIILLSNELSLFNVSIIDIILENKVNSISDITIDGDWNTF